MYYILLYLKKSNHTPGGNGLDDYTYNDDNNYSRNYNKKG